MNERIKVLAMEAGFDWLTTPDQEMISENSGHDIAKLAELIMKECIQVLKDTGYPNAHGNYVGVEEIKQHFGIK